MKAEIERLNGLTVINLDKIRSNIQTHVLFAANQRDHERLFIISPKGF